MTYISLFGVALSCPVVYGPSGDEFSFEFRFPKGEFETEFDMNNYTQACVRYAPETPMACNIPNRGHGDLTALQ